MDISTSVSQHDVEKGGNGGGDIIVIVKERCSLSTILFVKDHDYF